jgi:hypothetical protein
MMTSKQKIQEVASNNFIIIHKHTLNGFNELYRKIQEINLPNKKVCYVCLSKPYTDLVDNLKEEHLNCDNVFFVDTLSSPSYDLNPVGDCVFVRGMENLDNLRSTIKKAIKKHDCSTVVFDSISALLVYQLPHAIIKFTHNLLIDEAYETTKKVYITLSEPSPIC